MGLTKDKRALFLGIVMLVLGIVLVTGPSIDLPWLMYVGAVLLVIIGVLMAVKQLPGGLLMGIIGILLGALVLLPNDIVSDELQWLFNVLDIAVGVLLIVFGVLNLVRT